MTFNPESPKEHADQHFANQPGRRSELKPVTHGVMPSGEQQAATSDEEQEANLLQLKNDLAAAMAPYLKENGITLTPEQIAKFSAKDILGLASGELRINRNPAAGSGRMVEWIGPANLPPNGHAYI